MSHEYRNKLDIRNNEKIDRMLDEMPDFIEYFYNSMVAKSRSTNTILGYMYELTIFLRFIQTITKKDSIREVEVKDLEKLNQHNIEIYIAKSEDGKELSDTAKCRKLSVLKTVYNYYLGTEMISKNPTALCSGPRIKEHDVLKLTDAQVSALLDCIRYQQGMSEHAAKYNERLVQRDLAIVMTLLGTGMRISELVGLNISDIDKTDPNRKYLHIVRKGGDSDKVRAIDPVYEAISDYLAFSRPSLVSSDRENALFISTRGGRMSVNAIQKMLDNYCKKAELPDYISPHKMRATFATKVYSETKDIYAIKDALHHSTIDTSKHYISDKEKRIDAAAEAAGKLFE